MHWWVSTPEYTVYYQDEPPETGSDWISVEADTKREAIRKGVADMRSPDYMKGLRTYYRWGWDKETNPFTGVKAESAECPHGVCFCDRYCENELEDCPPCNEEAEKAYQESIVGDNVRFN